MSTQKGMISEKYTEYFFLRNGFKVLQPELADSPFDLLVSKDYVSFYKIQVKTLRPTTDRDDCFHTALKRGRGMSIGYSAKEVDYFALFEPVNENLYIVPYEEAPKSTIKIYCNGVKYKKYMNKIEL